MDNTFKSRVVNALKWVWNRFKKDITTPGFRDDDLLDEVNRDITNVTGKPYSSTGMLQAHKFDE